MQAPACFALPADRKTIGRSAGQAGGEEMTECDMRVSLCVITGNEEAYVLRFLNSFGKDFDELCMVRAVGNQEHDRTVAIARTWCAQNGKDFVFAEYRNAGWTDRVAHSDEVEDDDPATWRHVDDFAAARNMSWALATGDWQFWADLDDVLSPASEGLIRECANSGAFDYYFFTYGITTSNEVNMRERLFRRGSARWSQPIHENCNIRDLSKKWTHDARVIYSHEPDTQKKRDPDRNRRICEYHLRYLNAFAPEIQREYFWRWQNDKSEEAREGATKWAELSHQCDILPEQRVAMLLNMATLSAERDLDHAIDLCWNAARIAPWLREPWGVLAELELKHKEYNRADFMATLMQMMKKPPTSGMPFSRRFYEDQGFYLKTQTMRGIKRIEQADKAEREMFVKHGSRISLLHATRGRPAKALEARSNFLRAAINPFAVEHIFAIDADDEDSIEALRLYRHVIVEEPNGCVKAWNAAAAASSGNILVQLSDDWLPCIHWDELIWLALREAADKRAQAAGATLDNEEWGHRTTWENIYPLVLAVSDNHRRDALLCMAICTRARYELQGGELFSSDYFGVFSDNEFTVRAYDDGVVVQAQHIVFDHRHPVFEGKPVAEWDETHRRQNHPERYREGLEIFNRRNPAHAIKPTA